MEDDDVVTREQVTRWLPRTIWDAIAASTPCISGVGHHWDRQSYDLTTMESAFRRTVEWWACSNPACEAVVRTKP